jgi:hypothetical protein
MCEEFVGGLEEFGHTCSIDPKVDFVFLSGLKPILREKAKFLSLK